MWRGLLSDDGYRVALETANVAADPLDHAATWERMLIPAVFGFR